VYGATKVACEQMLRSSGTTWGQPFVGLRYMNIYGPRMDDRGAYVSVIMRILGRLHRGEAPVIYGDGKQTLDFVHVTDAARANVLAMSSACTDEVVNVASGFGT